MTSWTELRTAVTVGTERRSLADHDGPVAGISLDPDLSPELRALHAAALLGAARTAAAPLPAAVADSELQEDRPGASQPLVTAPVATTPGATTPGATEPVIAAPARAVQLLELMIGDSAGPGKADGSLFEIWFTHCAQAGAVLPHHMLVAVLDWASSSRPPAGKRDLVRPVLGERGHWLASHREQWSWATEGPDRFAANAIGHEAVLAVDLDRLLDLDRADQVTTIRRLRRTDPVAGRRLVADAVARVDASTRAALLECLDIGLEVADEALLESALDDRSKSVRQVAIALLDRLPESARAARLADWLAPHVERSGRLRLGITVRFPPPPEGEQLRDLPPMAKDVSIEHAWFDALVTGTPLDWWQDTLGPAPSKLVSANIEPPELLEAWGHAAVAQRNVAWAQALCTRVTQPALVKLAGPEAAERAWRRAVADRTPALQLGALLDAVPTPWSPAFAEAVLDWIFAPKQGKDWAPGTKLNHAHAALVGGLPVTSTDMLERRLAKARADEAKSLQTPIRHLIQQLSLRRSITEAFR